MMTPEQLAKSGTEESQQTAFFCACAIEAQRIPELKWIHAIANGGMRDKVTAGKLKAAGVRAGVWDVFLPVACGGRHGLYLEFKVGKNQLTEEQMAFGVHVWKHGYAAVVVRDWQKAMEVVKNYLLGRIV